MIILIFKFAPLLGLSVAFLDYDPIGGFAGAKFIGFDAFKEIFSSKDFYIVLRNTLTLNILDLVTGFPAPIILAIILNEVGNRYFKKITQTILYLPHFLSWVVIASIAYQLFSPNSGIVNILINSFGGQSVPFLTEKWHWLLTYNLIGVWQSMGWGTIIYLASITGISLDLYEAATVDGAGRWAKNMAYHASEFETHNYNHVNSRVRPALRYFIRAPIYTWQFDCHEFFRCYQHLRLSDRLAVLPVQYSYRGRAVPIRCRIYNGNRRKSDNKKIRRNRIALRGDV